jgi:hypothetical protein
MTNSLLINSDIKINQRVKVYRNLRKKVFSVLDKKSCRVISYQDALILSDVEFKIQKAGQERVRREKQKNVHAYVIGNYIGNKVDSIEKNKLIYYNPYITDTFIIAANDEPIYKAEKCYLINGLCYIDY